MWLGVAPRTDTKKDVFNRDWTTCSKHDNHSRLHNWVDLYDHLMSMRIFILILNEIFIRAPKIMRKVTAISIWIC